MDSLKETDKPAPNPSKHLRIEVDEELMRQMIAVQAPWIRKSSAGFPSRKKAQKKRFRSLCQNPRSTNRFRRSSLPLWLRGKMHPDFVVKKLTLPDFERTFFAPTDCRNRSAIYVSAPTKGKVSAILHLLGDDSTRLTALVNNMLRFVMSIYSDELNYLHEKKNSRRPF